MKVSGGLEDFNRDWTLKDVFMCSSLAAMCAHILHSNIAGPSYIIDVLVSMELQILKAKAWCREETIRYILPVFYQA